MNKRPTDDWKHVATFLPLRAQTLASSIVVDPLRPSDLNDLRDLFADDPEGGWPAGGWNEEDVDFVLKIRLDHYKRFGFGVYAVRDAVGTLMGMAGAQVWNEGDSTDVEVVAFIGRKYWRLGLAHTVLSYVIDRLKMSGLPRVLATTRPDNKKSPGMLTKLGFVRVGETRHWNVDALLWELLFAERE